MHRVSTVRVLTHHNRNTNCRKLLCTDAAAVANNASFINIFQNITLK